MALYIRSCNGASENNVKYNNYRRICIADKHSR